MAVEAEIIEQSITSAIPDASVKIEDLRGDGDHYAAYVVAESFRGMPRVKQHQMVYKALGDIMDSDLHALALYTRAPTEQG